MGNPISNVQAIPANVPGEGDDDDGFGDDPVSTADLAAGLRGIQERLL